MSIAIKKWFVTVTYATKDGPIDVDYAFDSLDDLGNIYKTGPNLECVISWHVQLSDPSQALTIEAFDEKERNRLEGEAR